MSALPISEQKADVNWGPLCADYVIFEPGKPRQFNLLTSSGGPPSMVTNDNSTLVRLR